MTTDRLIELAEHCQCYTVAESGDKKAGVFIEFMTPKDFNEIFQLAQRELVREASKDMDIEIEANPVRQLEG